jgi:hypothetical protein
MSLVTCAYISAVSIGNSLLLDMFDSGWILSESLIRLCWNPLLGENILVTTFRALTMLLCCQSIRQMYLIT